MSTTDPKPLPPTFEDVFDGLAYEALSILYDRQRKYGPENIRQQGLWGIWQRIRSDKMARIERAFNGRIEKGQISLDDIADADDETWEDGVFDLVNYGLIMIAVKRGLWGFPMREETREVETLAASHPEGIPPQLTLTPEEEEAEQARHALAGDDIDPDTEDEYSLPGRIATAGDLDELNSYLNGEVVDEPMPDREAAVKRLEARASKDWGGF